jgi:SAM-dependent methyltransferase
VAATIEECLSGTKLYGDDFDSDEIAAWFADEAQAYTDMTGANADDSFGYTQWAIRHGYRHLPSGRTFDHVLGFGSGRGTELEPINGRAGRFTVVESSTSYVASRRLTKPVRQLMAQPSGDIGLCDGDVDLVVCLGVLHHIPNVSHVVGEFGRVVPGGGYAIIREPVTSMGDWREPRPGLTRRERGIPRALLRSILTDAGFEVEHETLVGFPLIANTWRWLGKPPYNTRAWTVLDQVVCATLAPNLTYHATARFRKLRPTSVAIVARRRS